MRSLRCAIIGCGRIGCGFEDKSVTETRTHASAYLKNPKTNLVSLCDIDESKLKKNGKKFGIKKLYTKTTKMYLQENLDCVSICTLAQTHLELVKEAAKYGIKGIFLEKPISDNLPDTKKIIKICSDRNIVLVIDHQRRFDPFYHSIKRFIKNGKLGKIQLVNIYYGGGITNTGSHIFDLLRLFFGDVKSIEAKFSRNKSHNKNDPNVDATIEFRMGTLCFLHGLNLKNYGICEIDVLGTKGRLFLDVTTNNIQYQKISSKNSQDYKHLILKPSPILKSKHAANLSLVLQNFIECIHTKKKPLCTGYDGLKSLELIIASLQSAKKSSKIHFPLRNEDYIISSK